MSGLLRNFSLIGKTHRTEYRVSGFWTDIPSCFQLDVPTRKDYGFEKKGFISVRSVVRCGKSGSIRESVSHIYHVRLRLAELL
jgi:hypothetical protein